MRIIREAGNWYKTILATPDGANHALRLIGALDAFGNPYNGTLSSDDGQSYDLYDFAGYTNLNCGLSLGKFAGTLIFATADSTYIRVEANTVTNTWVAYFPNGTQITGPNRVRALFAGSIPLHLWSRLYGDRAISQNVSTAAKRATRNQSVTGRYRRR